MLRCAYLQDHFLWLHATFCAYAVLMSTTHAVNKNSERLEVYWYFSDKLGCMYKLTVDVYLTLAKRIMHNVKNRCGIPIKILHSTYTENHTRVCWYLHYRCVACWGAMPVNETISNCQLKRLPATARLRFCMK